MLYSHPQSMGSTTTRRDHRNARGARTLLRGDASGPSAPDQAFRTL